MAFLSSLTTGEFKPSASLASSKRVGTKLVRVRRSSKAPETPSIVSNAVPRDSPRKTRSVIIARKAPAVEAPIDPDARRASEAAVVPLSLVGLPSGGAPPGPRRDKTGSLLKRSVLGDPDEYEAMAAVTRGPGATEHVGSPAGATPVTELNSNAEQERTLYYRQQEKAHEQRDALERSRRDEAIREEKDLARMLPHERVAEQRQERALLRWEEQNAQWNDIKHFLAAKTRRQHIDELVISRNEEYREILEEREIIERALPLFERSGSADIKTFWPVAVRIGHPLTGLVATAVPPNTSPVERIRIPRESMAGRSGGKHRWMESEYLVQRKMQLEECINTLQPPSADIGNLAVVGHEYPLLPEPPEGERSVMGLSGTMGSLMDTVRSRWDDEHRESGYYDSALSMTRQAVRGPTPPQEERAMTPPLDTPIPQDVELTVQGPSFYIRNTLKYLQFHTEVGIVCRKTLHTVNNGSTALHYKWRRVVKDNPLGVVEDSQQRFYFHDLSGTILPGVTHDFAFVFKSPNHGIFNQTWEFQTCPVVNDPPLTIELRAWAFRGDENRELRDDLRRAEEHKIIVTAAREIIESIIASIRDRPSAARALRVADPSTVFNAKNAGLNLHYSPALWKSLGNLFNYAMQFVESPEQKAWSGSVRELYDVVSGIPHVTVRSQQTTILNSLVSAAEFPVTSATLSLNYTFCYSLWLELSVDMSLRADLLRHQRNLPPRPFIRPDVVDGQDSEEEIIASLQLSERREKGGKRAKGKDNKKGDKDKDKDRDKQLSARSKSRAAVLSPGGTAGAPAGGRVSQAATKTPAPQSLSPSSQKRSKSVAGTRTKPSSAKTPAPAPVPKAAAGKTRPPSAKGKKGKAGVHGKGSSKRGAQTDELRRQEEERLRSEEENLPENWSPERRAEETECSNDFYFAVRAMLCTMVERFEKVAGEADEPWTMVTGEHTTFI